MKRIRFNEAAVKAVSRLALQKGVREAASAIQHEIVREVSSGYTPVDGASRPGDPPHMDQLSLVQAIDIRSKGDKMQVEIGTDHALALEQGTSTMEARPFIVPAVMKVANE